MACQMAIQSENELNLFVSFFLFFSVSGKVFPVTSLLSNVFAGRVYILAKWPK